MKLDHFDRAQLEQLIGDHLLGVASELRLIDVADLIAYIRLEKWGNLRSLIQSSTELHFKPAALRLAEMGEADLEWGVLPVITLPMEFASGGVQIVFKLKLDDRRAGISLISIATDCHCNGHEQLRMSVTHALEKARVKKRSAVDAAPITPTPIAPATEPQG